MRERGAFDVERIREIERDVHHETIAFLTNVAEHVGPEARFVHQGMTSSDVLDTCLAVQLKDAADLLVADLDRVLQLWLRAEGARLLNVRAADTQARGTPGPEASIAKLLMAELNKASYDLALDFLGPDALQFPSYAETRPEFAAVHGGSGDLRYDYLRSLANSIEGGTSEILRNILGERVLGLPKEPR